MLALAQHLIDQGYFRAGGEEYVEENGSYGLSTLLRDHVRLRRDRVEFDYPAKSGVRRTISLDDPLVVPRRPRAFAGRDGQFPTAGLPHSRWLVRGPCR